MGLHLMLVAGYGRASGVVLRLGIALNGDGGCSCPVLVEQMGLLIQR